MAKVRNQQQRLIRVGKATKKLLENWEEGAKLVSDFGVSIEQLRYKVTAERFQLSLVHRKEGKRLWQLPSPPHRAIVSRYYYVMYHAMRAVSFLHHCGDDFEAHSKLPQNIPADFPNAMVWTNKLKIARLNRNAADYDPYPKSQAVWEADAQNTTMEAESLITLIRSYLRNKGCPRV